MFADVTVKWTMSDDPTSSSATWTTLATNSDGMVEIYVHSDEFLTQAVERLTVKVEKTTGDVEHRFLCQGMLSCEYFYVMLEHLSFDGVYDVVDDTSEPLTGNVWIDGMRMRLVVFHALFLL